MVQALVQSGVLHDVYQSLNPSGTTHTHTKIEQPQDSSPVQITTSRLDFFLSNQAGHKHTITSEVVEQLIDSDHSLVTLTISTEKMGHSTTVQKIDLQQKREELQLHLSLELAGVNLDTDHLLTEGRVDEAHSHINQVILHAMERVQLKVSQEPPRIPRLWVSFGANACAC